MTALDSSQSAANGAARRPAPGEGEGERPARSRPPFRGLAIALLIAAPLLLLASAAALVISWRLSAEARDELAALIEVEGVVLQSAVKPTFVPDPVDPGEAPEIDPQTGMPSGQWNNSPQILVRYTLDGAESEQWIELESPLEVDEWWRAQQLVNRYRPGDRIDLWYDTANSGDLLLKAGNGGQKILVAGAVVAFFLALPACGLFIAAMLLRRVVREKPSAPADCEAGEAR
jgi:hypothetical protein